MISKNESLIKSLIKFRAGVLFIFVLLEVLLYDKLPLIQAIVSSIEYIFILLIVLLNKKAGIMYLISFTLISMGSWSYVIQENLPYNFWGLRLFGFSFNVLFTISISLYLLTANNFKISKISLTSWNKFFIRFIIQSILVGAILVFTLKENYGDNFLKDILVYLPYFFYLYLLSILSVQECLLIIKYGVASSIIAMLLSFLTNQFFEYGDGFSFALMNSFTFISIFTIFFFRKLFTRNQFIFLSSSILILLLSGRVFIGSKSIILVILLLFWVAFSSWKAIGYTLMSLLVLIIFINPLIIWISNNVNGDLIVSYKFTQIFSIFELVDIETIAMSNTSMGNIIAEGATIFKNMADHPLYFLFGKGFGGGLVDSNGYLSIYVGDGAGYGEIDLLRNQFTRMHLPLFEIILKAGITGLFMYIGLLYYAFKKRDIFSFSFFIIAITVFSNSKEMLLLCMLFDHVSSNSNLEELNYQYTAKAVAI